MTRTEPLPPNDQELFSANLALLERYLKPLPDKPEETPAHTLCALWLTASGNPASAAIARQKQLPKLDDPSRKTLLTLIDKRIQGTPLSHITGRQSFMGLELLAGSQALIPRKETELLAQAALEKLHQIKTASPCPRVIDLCTGCGNIALFLAVSVKEAHIFGSDISAEAIALAKQNAAFLGMTENVRFRVGDLFSPFEDPAFTGGVDLITCNPPYISSAKVGKMHQEISQYEPPAAFDGGPLGIRILVRLLDTAPRFLTAGGWLCLETGLGQGDSIALRAERTGKFKNITTIRNKENQTRVVMMQSCHDPFVNSD